ncbi:hypothetical protein CF327_g1737 [Tilletia walkeri]|nr:hypothetical protein CF327_g1737 [Tilletia walkeri]
MPAYEPIPQRSSLERMPLPGNGARQVSAGGARAATAGSSRHFDDDESIALTPLTPGQAGLKASSTQQQSKAEHYKDDTEEDDDDDDLDLPELTYGLEEDSVPLRRSGGKRPEAEDALEDDNPVRKVVPETDDPTLPSLTFRVILIGTLLCVLGAAVAQTFFYKSNSPSFSSYFVIIVSLPTGRWLARALPPRIVRVPFIGSFSLNPGPFSIKEHLLIAVLVSSGASSSYATDILNIQELFFHQRMSTLASLTLLITTQVLGFGFAGLVQNALVKPPSMIFPSTLVTTSLFYTLHGAGGDGRVGASAAVSGSSALNMRDRLRFFTLVFVATILYQFFPSLIFPTLSSIAVLCLVDNSNRAFRVMSSGFHGFGILNFSLDWTAIGSSGPLYQPWVSHVLLWHWKDMKRALRSGVSEDIHSRLMEAYDPVPRSWYIATVGLSLGASILLVMFSPLQLPVWALLLCVAIALVFLLPVGVIKATSDTGVGLNVITEFVAGYLMPGKPIANVAFKCYGYMTMSQALDLVTDMKLGHYMKVPPKHMFVAQTLGTVIGCVVNYVVLRIVLDPSGGYRNFLDGSEVDPTGQWDGRKVNMFYSASVIWGAVGPAEFFAGKYRKLYYGFLLGALAPVGPWLLHRYFSKRRLHRRVRPSSGVVSRISDFITDFPYDRIAWPIIFHGAGAPPNIPTNYMSQSWARRKHPAWFAKYNYILSAALDAGASINALIVFLLSITLLKYTPIPHWAGNPVLDSEHCKPGS